FLDQGPGGGRYYHFNTPEAAPLQAGRWYKIEMYLKPASASGRSDGVLRIWVDGVLSSNHTGIRTTAGDISSVYFDPTWGGVGGSAKSRTDYFRISHARISV